MAISKPIAAYNAENNVEAQMLCNYLEQNGIEAYVTLDESLVGMWTFGVLPEIHKPQVWIDQSNAEAAAALLVEYERERSRRKSRVSPPAGNADSIEVVCEDCGRPTTFSASKRGTVQDCSHCGAYVDVENDEDRANSPEYEG